MNGECKLRLGTRASSLAVWQAEWVAARLRELGIEVELVHITTHGDTRSTPIGSLGAQGIFTKEIQQALLDRKVDLAVHSLKDLPTEPIDGLVLAAVPPRESNCDVLVSPHAQNIDQLPAGARVGTGSARRRSQLLHQRSDLEVLEVRGNVETRLRKLDEGHYEALILAEAGLKRLGFAERIASAIPPQVMMPAVGQGALGLEARADDERTLACLASLKDTAAHAAVTAERSMLHKLRGGCLAPVGAWGRVEDGVLVLDGVVLSNDGDRRVAARAAEPLDQAEALGARVAVDLLSQGASELIETARGRE